MAITYEPLATTTLGSAASSVTFSSISGSYTDLVLVVSATWSGGSNSSFGFRLNSDTGSNYSITQLYGDGSSASSGRQSNQTKAVIGQINPTEFGTTIFQFQNYSNATTYKTTLSRSNVAGVITLAGVALWRNTAAITRIDLEYFDSAGTFDTGSTFTLYGIKSA
jgi:phage-related tail fiber protein